MPQNQFKPFATGDGANTLDPITYAAKGYLPQGFQNGVAEAYDMNTVLRQLSTVVAALGQFTADNQSADVLDDGVVANFETKFRAALSGALSTSTVHFGAASGTGDAMVVTASPPLVAASGGGYQAGSFLVVKTPNSANGSTAPTINANSIGSVAVERAVGSALAPGDIPASCWLILFFDGTACYRLGVLPSDIAAAVAAAIAPLQQEVLDAVSGSGVTLPSDATQLLQALLLGGGINIGTFGGTGDALTATIPGGVTVPTLKAGMKVIGLVPSASTGTTPTLAVAGFTAGSAATAIRRRDGSAPAAGDVAAVPMAFRYSSSGKWLIDGTVASDFAGLIGSSTVIQQAITNLLSGGGSGLANGVLANVQIITASGAYTPTTGAKRALFFATGAGGSGGGGTPGTARNGDGGNAGGTVVGFLNLTGVASVACTIGAGGAAVPAGTGGNTGNTGGNTTFGAYATAYGGLGGWSANGASSTNLYGTVSGTGGLFQIPGQAGESATGAGVPGEGGNSFWGCGGAPGDNQFGTTAVGAGAYGAGGGGGAYAGRGPSGAGGNGVILILEFA